MRTFLTLLFTAIAINAFAQENFLVENGDLVWQKVFEATPSPSQLAAQLSNVSELDNTINGELTDIEANYAAQGYRRMQISIYMTNPYSANVQVELKDDRYRVTVRNIRFVDLESTSYRNATKQYTPVSFLLVNGNSLKSSKTAQRSYDILNGDFLRRFDIGKKANDNW